MKPGAHRVRVNATVCAAMVIGFATAAVGQPLTNSPPAAAADPAPAWEFSATAMVYFVPDSCEYVQPGRRGFDGCAGSLL